MILKSQSAYDNTFLLKVESPLGVAFLRRIDLL